MIEHKLHNIYKALNDIAWRDTIFENLQYFYSEDELYLIRTLESTGVYHYCFVKARSSTAAISKFMGLRQVEEVTG